MVLAQLGTPGGELRRELAAETSFLERSGIAYPRALLSAERAARERLHISWVGKSIQDNSDRPPSVLVSQLRDHLAADQRYSVFPGCRLLLYLGSLLRYLAMQLAKRASGISTW